MKKNNTMIVDWIDGREHTISLDNAEATIFNYNGEEYILFVADDITENVQMGFVLQRRGNKYVKRPMMNDNYDPLKEYFDNIPGKEKKPLSEEEIRSFSGRHIDLGTRLEIKSEKNDYRGADRNRSGVPPILKPREWHFDTYTNTNHAVSSMIFNNQGYIYMIFCVYDVHSHSYTYHLFSLDSKYNFDGIIPLSNSKLSELWLILERCGYSASFDISLPTHVIQTKPVDFDIDRVISGIKGEFERRQEQERRANAPVAAFAFDSTPPPPPNFPDLEEPEKPRARAISISVYPEEEKYEHEFSKVPEPDIQHVYVGIVPNLSNSTFDRNAENSDWVEPFVYYLAVDPLAFDKKFKPVKGVYKFKNIGISGITGIEKDDIKQHLEKYEGSGFDIPNYSFGNRVYHFVPGSSPGIRDMFANADSISVSPKKKNFTNYTEEEAFHYALTGDGKVSTSVNKTDEKSGIVSSIVSDFDSLLSSIDYISKSIDQYSKTFDENLYKKLILNSINKYINQNTNSNQKALDRNNHYNCDIDELIGSSELSFGFTDEQRKKVINKINNTIEMVNDNDSNSKNNSSKSKRRK